MPRVYGKEFPERQLMAVISDLLKIPHFTTARGGTVRADFLHAVAEALGVEGHDALKKDPLLAACFEAATGGPMEDAFLSRGTTVKNETLQAIIDGIIRTRIAPRDTELGPLVVLDDFGPVDLTDRRDRRLLLRAVEQGRDQFRSGVMAAYEERCAVTRYGAVETLEATHISEYKGPSEGLVSNGLLLRSDIRALFERGALAVDEREFIVLLRPNILATEYASLAGTRIHLPKRRVDWPSPAALRNHREWCGL